MIDLVIGSMFSGKTTELLRRLERAHIGKRKTILLRPIADSRTFLTHLDRKDLWLETQFVKDLKDFDFSGYNTIGIDEGQFHNGLVQFCIAASLKNKQVIISALHATSEAQMFESIVELIPHCDNIIKLNAVCIDCGSEHGNYTYRLAGIKSEKVEVGGSESYKAVCRKCYFEGGK